MHGGLRGVAVFVPLLLAGCSDPGSPPVPELAGRWMSTEGAARGRDFKACKGFHLEFRQDGIYKVSKQKGPIRLEKFRVVGKAPNLQLVSKRKNHVTRVMLRVDGDRIVLEDIMNDGRSWKAPPEKGPPVLAGVSRMMADTQQALYGLAEKIYTMNRCPEPESQSS
jgi:hypothetical protein